MKDYLTKWIKEQKKQGDDYIAGKLALKKSFCWFATTALEVSFIMWLANIFPIARWAGALMVLLIFTILVTTILTIWNLVEGVHLVQSDADLRDDLHIVDPRINYKDNDKTEAVRFIMLNSLLKHATDLKLIDTYDITDGASHDVHIWAESDIMGEKYSPIVKLSDKAVTTRDKHIIIEGIKQKRD